MRINWKAMGTAAAAAALGIGFAAMAQPGQGGHGRGNGAGIAKMMDALNLTDAQRQKVQPLLDEQRTAGHALREKMRDDHQALKAAMDVAQPDATTVGKAMLQVKADRDAAKVQREALHAKIAKILTPEQNAKLDGFLAGLRAGHGARGMGRGHGGDFAPAN